jgi:SAM-dependent methyltransferase
MPCPVCKGKSPARTLESHGPFVMKQCPSCDVVHAEPMRNPGSDWYEHSALYCIGRHLRHDLAWHHHQVLELRPPGQTLLDVGCGSGSFLNAARLQGYDVWGLDFDKSNIQTARERYRLKNIFPMSIETFASRRRRRFDVVTFFEVLEHMQDPPGFMASIRRLVKPGGLIALSCPNRDRSLDTLGEGDRPPNHLTRWNAAILHRFVERSGFKVEAVHVKPFDRDEISAFLRRTIRLRFAHTMAHRAVQRGNPSALRTAGRLMRLKGALLATAALPLSWLARPFPLQGTGLLCVARRPR